MVVKIDAHAKERLAVPELEPQPVPEVRCAGISFDGGQQRPGSNDPPAGRSGQLPHGPAQARCIAVTQVGLALQLQDAPKRDAVPGVKIERPVFPQEHPKVLVAECVAIGRHTVARADALGAPVHPRASRREPSTSEPQAGHRRDHHRELSHVNAISVGVAKRRVKAFDA